MTYVFRKSFLPLSLLAAIGSAHAQLALEVDQNNTPLSLAGAGFDVRTGIISATSEDSLTQSKVACYDSDGNRADVDPFQANMPLLMQIDGNSYELGTDIVYSTVTGSPLIKVDSLNGQLDCKASGETDLFLAFDDERYGPPIRLGHAVTFSPTTGLSELVTRDVVICNGSEQVTPRGDLNLELKPWLPDLAAIVDDPFSDPSDGLWVASGFGPLGDVFGDNIASYSGTGNVLTVDTHDGFSCFTFPFADESTFQTGLVDDEWFLSCVDPDGIFCDEFFLDPAKTGLATVLERLDVQERAEIDFAAPGQIVEIQMRAVNLGPDTINDGLIRALPMMEICDSTEVCYPLEPELPVASYDIPITGLLPGADFITDTFQFQIPVDAQTGEKYRFVAATFRDSGDQPGPQRSRSQLVIEVDGTSVP